MVDTVRTDPAAGGLATTGTGEPGTGPRTRLGMRLLGSELALVFRRPRNLAALGVLALVPVLIGVAVRIFGPETGDQAQLIVTRVAGNGLFLTFVSFIILTVMLLPVTVAVVSGDTVAGEANSGTLRYLLAAPAGRTRLLVIKYVSIVAFCLAACLVVAASALIAGMLLFPVGPITLLSGTTIPFTDGLLRVVLVVGYVTAGMAALGAVGLAISTLTEAPIGAIAATAACVIIAQVVHAIPQISVVHPYLVSHWWTVFDGVLRDPMALDQMGQGLLVFAAYIVVFGSIAWAKFTSRDISS
jgi:hypothetical protein